MKVLMLDVDNVLNDSFTSDHLNVDHYIYIGLDTDKIERLNRIIESTGAKIVISSSWRDDSRFIDYLKKRMGQVSDTLPMTIIGQTPFHPTFGRNVRNEEIQEWLDDNKESLKIDRFVILDDINTEGMQAFGDSFMLTNPKNGLTDEIADNCIKFLNS
jgi:hypothetical protein